MRLDRSVFALAAAGCFGWLSAVLLCNWLFYAGIINYGILYEGTVRYWAEMSERGKWDRIRLLAVRMAEMGAVFTVTRFRFRRAGSLFAGVAAGFAGGSFFTLLVWSRGVSGAFVFLASGFPQNLAYLPCLFLLLIAGVSERSAKKERLITITSVLLAAGIWLELCLNSLIVKLF